MSDAMEIKDAVPCNLENLLTAQPPVDDDDDAGDDVGNAPPVKKPEDKPDGEPKEEGWDKNRQRLDETAATARKNADALASMQQSIEGLSGQFRGMIAEALSATDSKPTGQAPAVASASSLMAQIKDIDPTEIDVEDMFALIQRTAEAVDAGTADKAALLQELESLRTKDAARDSREAMSAADSMVENHLRTLERQHFDGKRTHRNDVIKATQEVLARMGFNQTDNPPPASTAITAATLVTERISATEQAAQRERDRHVTPDGLDRPSLPKLDGEGNMTLKQAVKSMKL